MRACGSKELIGSRIRVRIEITGDHSRSVAGDEAHARQKQLGRFRSRLGSKRVKMRVEPVKHLRSIVRLQLDPGDHAREPGAPGSGTGLLRVGAEPEMSAI